LLYDGPVRPSVKEFLCSVLRGDTDEPSVLPKSFNGDVTLLLRIMLSVSALLSVGVVALLLLLLLLLLLMMLVSLLVLQRLEVDELRELARVLATGAAETGGG